MNTALMNAIKDFSEQDAGICANCGHNMPFQTVAEELRQLLSDSMTQRTVVSAKLTTPLEDHLVVLSKRCELLALNLMMLSAEENTESNEIYAISEEVKNLSIKTTHSLTKLVNNEQKHEIQSKCEGSESLYHLQSLLTDYISTMEVGRKQKSKIRFFIDQMVNDKSL